MHEIQSNCTHTTADPGMLLYQAVNAIVTSLQGFICVDACDYRAMLDCFSGRLALGQGQASGTGRALEAVRLALASITPSVTDFSVIRGVAISIRGMTDYNWDEIEIIVGYASNIFPEDCILIAGASLDKCLSDELEVTILTDTPPVAFDQATVDTGKLLYQAVDSVLKMMQGVFPIDKSVFRNFLNNCSGRLALGQGRASGNGKALEAARLAVSNLTPSISDGSTTSTTWVVAAVSIHGTPDTRLEEIDEIRLHVFDSCHSWCDSIAGSSINTHEADQVEVTVLSGRQQVTQAPKE